MGKPLQRPCSWGGVCSQLASHTALVSRPILEQGSFQVAAMEWSGGGWGGAESSGGDAVEVGSRPLDPLHARSKGIGILHTWQVKWGRRWSCGAKQQQRQQQQQQRQQQQQQQQQHMHTHTRLQPPFSTTTAHPPFDSPTTLTAQQPPTPTCLPREEASSVATAWRSATALAVLSRL
jgi:hypothetical protein